MSDTKNSESKPFVKGNAFSFTITVGESNLEFPKIFTPEGEAHLHYAVWQTEKGENKGTVHIQGSAALISGHEQMRILAVKKLFKPEFAAKIWLGAIKKSELASVRYCMKAETRMAGPWKYGNVPDSIDAMREIKKEREAAKQEDEFEKVLYKGRTALKGDYDTFAHWLEELELMWSKIKGK